MDGKLMILEVLTRKMCSSFKITLYSYKHSKAERKMKWPNPEIGSDLLACDKLYSCLQAQVQQKVSRGMWHYPVMNLSTFLQFD